MNKRDLFQNNLTSTFRPKVAVEVRQGLLRHPSQPTAFLLAKPSLP
jgi:hypothetical protein